MNIRTQLYLRSRQSLLGIFLIIVSLHLTCSANNKETIGFRNAIQRRRRNGASSPPIHHLRLASSSQLALYRQQRQVTPFHSQSTTNIPSIQFLLTIAFSEPSSARFMQTLRRVPPATVTTYNRHITSCVCAGQLLYIREIW